jgi:SAM-dependent methyltransferase
MWNGQNFNLASPSRTESNQWLQEATKFITGDVLSIGSMEDKDGAGYTYREYFLSADSYTTSDMSGKVDLILDVRDMPSVPDGRYNCLFICGVLEHVDNLDKAMKEIYRILAPGGTVIAGVPFRQPIHSAPQDFWRFTQYALEYLFKDYEIQEIKEIDASEDNFPVAYWIKCNKLTKKNAKESRKGTPPQSSRQTR